MTVSLDIMGYRFDDAEPSFIDCGTFWWHRPTAKLLTKAGVAAYAAAEGKAMSAKESGRASAAWMANNCAVPQVAAPPAPPALTGITAGAPATLVPAGALPPANLAAAKTAGALGNTTAWTTGQFVTLGDASEAHWDGADWAAGKAA